VFYPRGLADREKLSFYARYLDAVEVNSTFYRPVGAETARRWVERTPPVFRFSVKLFQKFTHAVMYAESIGKPESLTDADVLRFKQGIAPIVDAEKLGALLAQFPPSFQCNPSNLEQLEQVIRDFRELPMTVELRHRSWTESPETEKLLLEYGVAWTMIDEPNFRTSIGDVPQVGRLGYLRFHGRNAKEWWHGDRESRYDYLYSATEQDQLQRQIRHIADRVQESFVVYNNHFGGKAVVNAIQTKVALGGALDTPCLIASSRRFLSLRRSPTSGQFPKSAPLTILPGATRVRSVPGTKLVHDVP
jgi:uncharacterized protein YecE (DUF72 family)